MLINKNNVSPHQLEIPFTNQIKNKNETKKNTLLKKKPQIIFKEKKKIRKF